MISEPRRHSVNLGLCLSAVLAASLWVVGPGCSSSRCETDDECFADEQCIRGVCQVPEDAAADTEPTDAADTDAADTDGTSNPDVVDSSTTDDASMDGSDAERDGGAKDTSGGDADTEVERDTGVEPDTTDGGGCGDVADGDCSCTYDPNERNDEDRDGDHAYGVCLDQLLDGSGTCQTPSDYESPEQASCHDDLDNDCDGRSDEGEKTRTPGESCTRNCECISNRCVEGECAHRIFVTSTAYEGDMGGAAGADSECNTVAADEGLEGEWKAIVSAIRDARSRVDVHSSVYNTNGDKVADGETDLWDGSIDSPVLYDEAGGPEKTNVWTGTAKDGGLKGDDCEDWTSLRIGAIGQAGHSNRDGGKWLEFTTNTCNTEVHLYCIDGQ